MQSIETVLTSFAPTTIVIFGITGDLAKKKLIPALFNLYRQNHLPKTFAIVGFARREWSDGDLQGYVESIFAEKGITLSDADKESFVKKFSMVNGDFTNLEAYQGLLAKMEQVDASIGMCSDKIFHLAVPPELYEIIFDHIHASGLGDLCSGIGGWTRILVEKPFGDNWDSAEKLDQKLGQLFKEEQIFRVDHYMSKEAVQNILAFRFANSLFEHMWDSRFIESVSIRLWEKDGINGRGAFYDKVGALRDVGQNHVLQMLTFIAMEDPGVMDPKRIRSARVKVLDALRVISPDDVLKRVKRGQYNGYLEENGVNPTSLTETFFNIQAFIDNERWKDVPFTLESGKGMLESKTEIDIVFKGKTFCLLLPNQQVLCPQNRLIFRIQPNEGISVTFWSKKPGFGTDLEPRTLSFEYSSSDGVIPDAYERVIYDCIVGDQTLFTSTEEVFSSWKYITPILEHFDKVPLDKYTTTQG
jgi:glucose-6-phosphate 1-dehydrogenase